MEQQKSVALFNTSVIPIAPTVKIELKIKICPYKRSDKASIEKRLRSL